ncbi:MAG: choice-of-anchor S family protein, partial [Candidatus Heimdallarchaeota archaeon]
EVTAETTTYVDYDVTLGTDVHDYTSNGLGNVFLIILTLILPLSLPGMIGGTWNQTAIDLGPGFWGDFFMDPYFSEMFYDFSNNQTMLDEMTGDPGMSEITFKKFAGTFENSTDIAVFDWACDFDMVNASTTTDYGGKFRYKIAYDQTTSWVKGWKLFLDYSGTFEGQVIDVDWNQLVQQDGYTLGDFAIGTGLFPGFEWFLLFPALGLLALPAIIKRRRK